jgi:hypothetical protein
MPGKRELSALETRRHALLLESNLNRVAIQVECQRLRQSLNWFGNLRHSITPWMTWLAPLAGVFVASKIGGASKSGSLKRILKLLPLLFGLWKKFAR